MSKGVIVSYMVPMGFVLVEGGVCKAIVLSDEAIAMAGISALQSGHIKETQVDDVERRLEEGKTTPGIAILPGTEELFGKERWSTPTEEDHVKALEERAGNKDKN